MNDRESTIRGGVEGGAGQIVGLSDPMIGQVVGTYRIEREIGHGGMGTVYLAHRIGDFARQVAIKVVRRGMDTEHVLERFVSERQILAGLAHPNIARLLDGGSTSDGRPYLVMEYLDGVPIIAYCDNHALTIEARLRLFLVACGAVQYAHQHLVLHRDLKPGNVLVTPDGVPKLLDFGIARVLAHDDIHPAATVVFQRLLTREYASPEQRQGQSCGITSDVYSLGVILYELLSGTRPKREMTTQPEPPSSAAARLGARAPQHAVRQLRGDLDTIVVKALRHEQLRRYQTVHALAADLERYLDNRPILARPDSWSYRARKFAVRRWLSLAAVVVVVASLGGGMVAAARSARVAALERTRAEQRFEDVRKLTHALLFELHDEIRTLPGAVAVRQRLVARALEHLDRLSRDAGGDTPLQLELASAYDRLGTLAFDMNGAQASYHKAAALFEQLVATGLANRETVAFQVDNLINLADLLKMMGDTDAALTTAGRALAITHRWVEDAGGASRADEPLLVMLDHSHSVSGFIKEDAGEFTAALDDYAQALDAARARAERAPGNRDAQRRIGTVLTHQGINLLGTGQAAAALAALAEARTLLEPLLQAEPVNVVYQRDVWNMQLHTGRAQRAAGDSLRAVRSLQSALTIKQRLADADPNDTGHQRGLAVTRVALSQALGAVGQWPAALALVEQAMATSRRLAAVDPSNLESWIDLGEFGLTHAQLLARLGRAGESRAALVAARAELGEAAKRNPRNRRVATMLAQARSTR